jgi:hypothetical protein
MRDALERLYQFGTFCPPFAVLLLQKEEMSGYLRD